MPKVNFRSNIIWAPLARKTVRFLITSGVPLVAAYVHGFGNWILYLILGALLGFVGDAGGSPLLRLGFMAIGPLSVGLGALIGTLCLVWQAPWVFFCIAILTGMVYALVENRHGHMVMGPRFIGYGLVFGYSVTQINALDALLLVLALIWAWIVSLLWDVVMHEKRPFSVPSLRHSILSGYLHAPMRWRLAVSTGISVGLALLTTAFTGNKHAYWTMLTMLIVLHYNIRESALQITRRITGTLIGVFFVIFLVSLHATPLQLLLASLLVTILRWPAFAVHSGLGTACITAFVLLLAEMSIPADVNPMPVLIDRLLATFIGCAFSLFTLEIDFFLRYVIGLFEIFKQRLKRGKNQT
ncbi:MAG: FUSC family protein [Burkholderiaceae bacterium]|nr:FUSC family protein [Burkholderiaceae bacterium]